ncbi:MAG: DUF5309 domain-containing protein [Candidatus Sabulitectum sp.]|nr:DUF5309 domain-containing protein [Candidatus Sabulitectum sp.]
MAIITGAHSSYDEAGKGNREDLSDVIADVSPTETPFLSMLSTNKATATKHEWTKDTLAAAAQNAQLEGGEAVGVDPAARVRIDNYCQILGKFPVVTGTQEIVNKAQVKSEMAYQMARRMKEMKRDLELIMIGQSNVKVAGSESTAREMGSFDAYLVTNNQLAAGSSAPTGDGTDVSDYAGTDRALTETIWEAGLQSLFTNSGGDSNVKAIVTAATKGVISTFTSSATRYVTTDDKQLTASIDVYDGDFHTVTIIPDRWCKTGLAYIVDPEYVKLSNLRNIHSFNLAKTGDSIRKQIVWETTLETCNEKAHVLFGDLNT